MCLRSCLTCLLTHTVSYMASAVCRLLINFLACFTSVWKILTTDSISSQGRNHLFLLPGVSTWLTHCSLTGKHQELSILNFVRALQYFFKGEYTGSPEKTQKSGDFALEPVTFQKNKKNQKTLVLLNY